MIATDTPLIALTDLTKSFFTEELETRALIDVHLEIRRGEYVAVTGPSGCGKTTLLSVLGLLEPQTSGEFLFDGQVILGQSVGELAALRNRHIGFIFQAFNLLGDRTVFENVELPLVYRGSPMAERRERVAAALERVGLGHRTLHFPAQLSGGQQQRVAVARALVGAPDLLLADEPTGNLDSVNGETVMELLDELHAEGTTICMVTHDVGHAKRASRILQLLDGRIIGDVVAP